MKCPIEEIIKTEEPLVKNSYGQQIPDHPKFQENLAKVDNDIKLEDFVSVDYGAEEPEIKVKKELDYMEIGNQELIIKDEDEDGSDK